MGPCTFIKERAPITGGLAEAMAASHLSTVLTLKDDADYHQVSRGVKPSTSDALAIEDFKLKQ